MPDFILSLLIMLAATGCGVVGGTFFAFSTFVMKALGETSGSGGVEAMQRINRVILRSLFLPIFTGTAIIAAILAVWGIFFLSWPRTIVLTAGALLYIVGSFALTMRRNVPLNNQLDAVEPPAAGDTWKMYLLRWTQWNHVRTLTTLLAMVCFMLAL
jgi:uncharacterized membrane protein